MIGSRFVNLILIIRGCSKPAVSTFCEQDFAGLKKHVRNTWNKLVRLAYITGTFRLPFAIGGRVLSDARKAVDLILEHLKNPNAGNIGEIIARFYVMHTRNLVAWRNTFYKVSMPQTQDGRAFADYALSARGLLAR